MPENINAHEQIQAKFLVNDSPDLDDVYVALDGMNIQLSGESHYKTITYHYDTADFSLYRSGVTLCTQTASDFFTPQITLKTHGKTAPNGTIFREEYAYALAREHDLDLSAITDEAARQKLGDICADQLIKKFTTEINCSTSSLTLTMEGKKAVFEIAMHEASFIDKDGKFMHFQPEIEITFKPEESDPKITRKHVLKAIDDIIEFSRSDGFSAAANITPNIESKAQTGFKILRGGFLAATFADASRAVRKKAWEVFGRFSPK